MTNMTKTEMRIRECSNKTLSMACRDLETLFTTGVLPEGSVIKTFANICHSEFKHHVEPLSFVQSIVQKEAMRRFSNIVDSIIDDEAN